MVVSSRAMDLPSFATRVHYLGHATLLIELDGLRILTDPVLGDRVFHLRRCGPSGWAWYAAQPDPDLILLSHLHFDHLHLPSLQVLPTTVPMVIPRGAAVWLRRLVPQPLIELAPGERLHWGRVAIVATPARHGHRWGRWLGPMDLAQGYRIEGSRSIYFPGDTDLFPEMSAIGAEGLDLALLPVGGWGPTLGPGHLDPWRAAQALRLLQPRLAIPIHWATFRPLGKWWENMPYFSQPGPEFQRLAAVWAPHTVVHLLAPGESFHGF